jgi:hypothetical protein
MAEIVPRGRNQTFPVEHTHPLAHVQTISVPTEQDILAHPIYSQILNQKVNEVLSKYPPSQLTPALRNFNPHQRRKRPYRDCRYHLQICIRRHHGRRRTDYDVSK